MNLRINNLQKYYGEKVVFDNFSFSFTKTGAYLILGESGVGKTTLLRMIAGLDNEYSGEIQNGGVKNISFMFQEYRLFPTINAWQNVAIAKAGCTQDEASAMLMKLGFKNEDLIKKPRELSGGMKQRVAFARAVMKPSPILLLDEPTKELDTDTANSMLDIINYEAQTRLVIIVTHHDLIEKINNAQIIRL